MATLGPAQKLMNLNEDVPTEFYIFVNQLNPMTYHNFNLTKHFASAGYTTATFSDQHLTKYIDGTLNFLPFIPTKEELGAISPYCMTAINEYRIEYDAEYERVRINPRYPSRLSAIYAFGDYASCELVAQKYKWPLNEVRRFYVEPSPLTRVVKVNMEIASLMRYAYKVSMMQNISEAWQAYWAGAGNVDAVLPTIGFKKQTSSSGVIWEYLIDGAMRPLDPT